MSDDFLSRATAALRAEAESKPAPAELTRARVLASLRQVEQKRRVKRTYFLALAAALASSTAIAGARGDLPVLWNRARVLIQRTFGQQELAPPEPAPLASVRKKTPSVPPPAPPAPTVEAPVPEPEPSTESSTSPAPPASVPPVRPRRPLTPPAGVSPKEFALYREAHAVHFGGHNPALALAKWDAYLAEPSARRFVQEARYNRALCLVRLGRTQQAQTELLPFAQRAYGAYRCREARSLLAELDNTLEFSKACD